MNYGACFTYGLFADKLTNYLIDGIESSENEQLHRAFTDFTDMITEDLEYCTNGITLCEALDWYTFPHEYDNDYSFYKKAIAREIEQLMRDAMEESKSDSIDVFEYASMCYKLRYPHYMRKVFKL